MSRVMNVVGAPIVIIRLTVLMSKGFQFVRFKISKHVKSFQKMSWKKNMSSPVAVKKFG